MPDVLLYLLIAAALAGACLVAGRFAGFNQIPQDEPESQERARERSENGDIAHGVAMGNPFDYLFAVAAILGKPRASVPWWRRWRYRMIVFAILAALLISGSRLL